MTTQPRARTRRVTPVDRLEEIRDHAHRNGWDTTTVPIVGGLSLIGERTVDGIAYGFMVAYGTNDITNRVSALSLDGNPRKRFVMTDGKGEWTGPAGSWRLALERPAWWTGRDDGEPAP